MKTRNKIIVIIVMTVMLIGLGGCDILLDEETDAFEFEPTEVPKPTKIPATKAPLMTPQIGYS